MAGPMFESLMNVQAARFDSILASA
jgi:hypothetical protein